LDETNPEKDPPHSAQVRKVYERFLYHYEKLVNPSTSLKLTSKKDKVRLKDLKPELLREVPVMTLESRESLSEDMIKSIYEQEVCIIRNF